MSKNPALVVGTLYVLAEKNQKIFVKTVESSRCDKLIAKPLTYKSETGEDNPEDLLKQICKKHNYHIDHDKVIFKKIKIDGILFVYFFYKTKHKTENLKKNFELVDISKIHHIEDKVMHTKKGFNPIYSTKAFIIGLYQRKEAMPMVALSKRAIHSLKHSFA